jgi:hypothetical protein
MSGDLIDAFDDFELIVRLEFVQALLCNRMYNLSDPNDSTLLVAHGVLKEAMRVLKTVPKVAQLRGPTG